MLRGRGSLADREAKLEELGRVELLKAIPEFATLPESALAAVALRLEEERHPRGAIVFSEGDPGDRMLVVVEGRGELSAQGLSGRVPVATIGPGDLTGAIALVSGTPERTATLVALTPIHALALHRPAFEDLVAEHPATRAAFERHADHLLTASFVRSVGPFVSLDGETARWLAARLEQRLLESVHRERIVENAAVFDFEIPAGDMERLDALHDGTRTAWNPEAIGLFF